MADQHALDDAAVAALWPLRDYSKEHLGLVYGDDLQRTPTFTQKGDGSVAGSFKIPAGTLRALFHNHPARSKSRAMGADTPDEFSPKDRMTAERLGVPSYILAGNRVMRYDPKTRQTEEVLAQFPIEEFLQFIAMKRSRENPIAAAIIAEQNSKPTRVASNGR